LDLFHNTHFGYHQLFSAIFQHYENISQIDAKNFCQKCEVCAKFTAIKKDPHVQHLLKSKYAVDVLAQLKNLFQEIGTPKIVQMDNGGEFIGSDVVDFLKGLGIEIAHGRPRHPQAQGS